MTTGVVNRCSRCGSELRQRPMNTNWDVFLCYNAACSYYCRPQGGVEVDHPRASTLTNKEFKATLAEVNRKAGLWIKENIPKTRKGHDGY